MKINILKWGSIIMLQVGILSGIILLFSSLGLSCVSVPKKVKNEPIICEKASQWSYLAIKDKSGKFPESVSTSGVYSCVDTLKVQTCNEERRKYFAEHEPTGDKYNDLMTSNRGDRIYDSCMSDMKR